MTNKITKLMLNWEGYEIREYPSWRQPWANTLVYYNINDNDTSSTIYDLSWNNVDQAWHWTSSYTTDATYGRVATFNWSNYTSAWSIVDFGWELTTILLVQYSGSNTKVTVTEWASGSRRPSIWYEINRDNHQWVRSYYSDGLNSTTVTYSGTMQQNTWYMLASTRDSNGVAKLYINWNLEVTELSSQTPGYTGWDNLMIGKRFGEQNLIWQFKLFIWENRCWTDAEIAALAQEYWFTVN